MKAAVFPLILIVISASAWAEVGSAKLSPQQQMTVLAPVEFVSTAENGDSLYRVPGGKAQLEPAMNAMVASGLSATVPLLQNCEEDGCVVLAKIKTSAQIESSAKALDDLSNLSLDFKLLVLADVVYLGSTSEGEAVYRPREGQTVQEAMDRIVYSGLAIAVPVVKAGPSIFVLLKN